MILYLCHYYDFVLFSVIFLFILYYSIRNRPHFLLAATDSQRLFLRIWRTCLFCSLTVCGIRVQIVPQLALRLSSLLFILFIYCLGSALSVSTATTSTIEKYHVSCSSSHTVRIFLSSNSFDISRLVIS